MTESKVVVWEALANKAILEQAKGEDDAPVTIESLTVELERVFGAPAKQAAGLVSRETLKPPKVVEPGAPATLQRAALSLLDPEIAMDKAFERVGITREMIPEIMQSPNWAGVMAEVCRQYLFITNLPRLVAAQVKKAALGDTAAFKALGEAFGKGELDLDEQTRALAEASPETRLRATEAIIEDLQRIVTQAKGQGASQDAIEAAKLKAIASAQERKKSGRG